MKSFETRQVVSHPSITHISIADSMNRSYSDPRTEWTRTTLPYQFYFVSLLLPNSIDNSVDVMIQPEMKQNLLFSQEHTHEPTPTGARLCWCLCESGITCSAPASTYRTRKVPGESPRLHKRCTDHESESLKTVGGYRWGSDQRRGISSVVGTR